MSDGMCTVDEVYRPVDHRKSQSSESDSSKSLNPVF